MSPLHGPLLHTCRASTADVSVTLYLGLSSLRPFAIIPFACLPVLTGPSIMSMQSQVNA